MAKAHVNWNIENLEEADLPEPVTEDEDEEDADDED